MEKLLPLLEDAGYSHVYAAGPGKKHGCLVAFARNKYTKKEDRTVLYDEQTIRRDTEERACRGSSFQTKNIASLVALEAADDENMGIVVATTHLFWHPRYDLNLELLVTT